VRWKEEREGIEGIRWRKGRGEFNQSKEMP
jgi:hypothetical protein